jgi:hypothetical protein
VTTYETPGRPAPTRMVTSVIALTQHDGGQRRVIRGPGGRARPWSLGSAWPTSSPSQPQR